PLLLNFFEGWASQPLLDAVASLSFMTHFNAISRGVLDFRDLLFFVLMIVGWLTATAIVIDMKKAQ
ncbi:MAG TPA: ABC transporter permease, partial [Pseudomonadales bacterium]|nr:ABC transporter permease [Pseudomonadales bacterium]